jgi:pilus assembly protein CpaF
VSSNGIFRPGPGFLAVPGAPLQPQTLEALVDAGFDPSLLQRPEDWWRSVDPGENGQELFR